MRIPKLLLLVACVAGAFAPLQSLRAGEVTKAVTKAIEARDCTAAVRELNLALAGASTEALLFGGSMFEQGLCLKQNTERAARLYTRAAEAGAGDARSRLAALYASPAAGPDKGSAIWWALQANLPLPKPCLVGSEVRSNVDAFAQALSAWPAGMLDACVHVTGVLAALDSEFIVKPANESQAGVAIDFRPATGSLDAGSTQVNQTLRDSSARVTEAHSMTGVLQSGSAPSPEQLRAQQAQQELQALAKQVETIGRDALARFHRPANIDKDWRIQLRAESARSR
jgi:TPR repeat protein